MELVLKSALSDDAEWVVRYLVVHTGIFAAKKSIETKTKEKG